MDYFEYVLTKLNNNNNVFIYIFCFVNIFEQNLITIVLMIFIIWHNRCKCIPSICITNYEM